LAERVVKRDGDKLDLMIGGGGVGWSDDCGRDGDLVERARGSVVAKLGLKECSGAVRWEEPFSGSGKDMNLVNPLLAWNKDLEVDTAIGCFFFSILDLFAGEVPIGE